MLKLKADLIGTDADGNEVFMGKGDAISEISDAGSYQVQGSFELGWNVTVRFSPRYWSELVTVDAVKLLKALEGK